MVWARRSTANKYGAKKVEKHGRQWPSLLELAVYERLLLRERAGEISDIKLQVHVRFHTYDHGKIHMIPDFSAVDTKTGVLFYIEAKGFKTNSWLRKRKAWKVAGPGLMEVWEGNHRYPKLVEKLEPKGVGNAQDGGSGDLHKARKHKVEE